jgi:hypothetical protein
MFRQKRFLESKKTETFLLFRLPSVRLSLQHAWIMATQAIPDPIPPSTFRVYTVVQVHF